MRLDRRSLVLVLGSLTLPVSTLAQGESELEEHVIEVPGERLASRCLLVTPRAPSGTERLLVLCHGLGQTSVEETGIRAWVDRYGLASAYRRLRTPPVAGALGLGLADAYAARFERAFAEVGKRPLRIATSAWDNGRKASERLAERLAERGIDAELSLPPGPHDQRWLREVGSLELLFDCDRLLPGRRERSKKS
jgi:hypothetical protein